MVCYSIMKSGTFRIIPAVPFASVLHERGSTLACITCHFDNSGFTNLQDVCSRTDGDCLSKEEQFALEVLSIIGVVLSLIGIISTAITLIVFK